MFEVRIGEDGADRFVLDEEFQFFTHFAFVQTIHTENYNSCFIMNPEDTQTSTNGTKDQPGRGNMDASANGEKGTT